MSEKAGPAEVAAKTWRELPEADRQFVLRGLKRVLMMVCGPSSMAKARAVTAAIDLLAVTGSS